MLYFYRLYLGFRDYNRYLSTVQKIKNNEVLYTEGSIQLDDSDWLKHKSDLPLMDLMTITSSMRSSLDVFVHFTEIKNIFISMECDAYLFIIRWTGVFDLHTYMCILKKINLS